MKLAFIFNQDKLSGKMTKLFTGCYCYHTAWVDEEAGHMYDMNLLYRRRKWPHYPEANVIMFDVPEVTRDYLEAKLTNEESRYGVMDYCLFLIRPILHLFGKPTINVGGEICSETCNDDLWACGIETPWSYNDSPPSPCDLYKFMKERSV